MRMNFPFGCNLFLSPAVKFFESSPAKLSEAQSRILCSIPRSMPLDLRPPPSPMPLPPPTAADRDPRHPACPLPSLVSRAYNAACLRPGAARADGALAFCYSGSCCHRALIIAAHCALHYRPHALLDAPAAHNSPPFPSPAPMPAHVLVMMRSIVGHRIRAHRALSCRTQPYVFHHVYAWVSI
jgi:hypothetical protein